MKHFTKEEAIELAKKYNLEDEVLEAMAHGCNPDEALEDWDLYPFIDMSKTSDIETTKHTISKNNL